MLNRFVGKIQRSWVDANMSKLWKFSVFPHGGGCVVFSLSGDEYNVLTKYEKKNTIIAKGVDNMATVSIRMDDDLKKDVESVCDELGLSMTAAFTIFARKLSREKRIPFEVSIDPFYSDMNMAALHESIEQMEKGRTIVKSLDELEEMADE